MLGFDDYKSMRKGTTTLGEVRKRQADVIMEQTWDGDIQTKTMYLYDFYHDPEPKKLRNLDIKKYKNLSEIRAKYIIGIYQSLEKDTVPFKIQLRPSQECNVPYYAEYFGDRYNATFPVGLYVAIPDEKGDYHRWLVVDVADDHAPQFPTYQILPCDYVLNWIFENKRYSMVGCLRSQNSYNSGEWTSDKITFTEDQQKVILPLNRISELIYYNQRLIMDNFVLTEPRTWHVSKINRLSSNGTTHLTCAQDVFDPQKDYIEKDESGNVIAFWADYFTGNVTPEDDTKSNDNFIRGEITFSGSKPEIKLNGSYKKLTVNFYDNDAQLDHILGDWSFFVEGSPANVETLTAADSNDVEENQIKIKLKGDEDLLGKTITARYDSIRGASPELELDIVGL